jgi:hypothetical protein
VAARAAQNAPDPRDPTRSNFTPAHSRLINKNRIRAGFIPFVIDEKKGRIGNKERALAVYKAEARFIRGAGYGLSPLRAASK